MKPRPGYPTMRVVAPRDAALIKLLGGSLCDGVQLTHSQVTSLEKLYEIQEEVPDPNWTPPEPPKPKYPGEPMPPARPPLKNEGYRILQAGAERNMFRHAQADGLRMVAWLARFVEPGEDPLRLLIQLVSDAGWDVDPEDYDYAADREEEESRKCTCGGEAVWEPTFGGGGTGLADDPAPFALRCSQCSRHSPWYPTSAEALEWWARGGD